MQIAHKVFGFMAFLILIFYVIFAKRLFLNYTIESTAIYTAQHDGRNHCYLGTLVTLF